MQTREVSCVNLDTGMRVDEVFCNQSARPPDTQRCGSGPCASRWRRGPWSKVMNIYDITTISRVSIVFHNMSDWTSEA